MLTLHHKVFGQGPALLILHGLFGSLDNWVSHARTLSETYSVYLIDQRNHGKSPHTDEWNYASMAEDLHDFMDQHGIMQGHLLGHSMGGKTVMQFAGEYPERIDRLIVADMGVRQYPPHHEHILNAIRSLPLSQLESRKEAKELLEQQISEQAIVQFILKSLGRDEEKQFRWKFNFDVIDANYHEVLAPIQNHFSYDGDTLFLSGSESQYVRKEDHTDILEQFPEAQFEVLQGAGHWLHADRPADFVQSVNTFLTAN